MLCTEHIVASIHARLALFCMGRIRNPQLKAKCVLQQWLLAFMRTLSVDFLTFLKYLFLEGRKKKPFPRMATGTTREACSSW